ncbi:MAG: hypothetical protein LBO71_06615 [Prevotellaceae bacterium]|jgi:hypothetical protein|nr:hypothetical protein [Prevotellaceae bacterium]
MKQEIKSEGKCLFCGSTFAKASIIRHLQTHLAQKAKDGQKGLSFLVKIEADPSYGISQHFLSLWVDGDASMGDVDGFLRDIWLECCDHQSSFTNPKNRRQGGIVLDIRKVQDFLQNGKIVEFAKVMEGSNGEVSMSQETSKVFQKGLKLKYEYDFGSSTKLLLTVIQEYPFKADKDIVLLSRNEPLEILCNMCGKEPATQLCTVHDWNEDSLFCEKCAKEHAKTCPDFEEYAAMPVVNSPRMGVCAYEGGCIDTERDGVFVKK